MVHRRDSDPGPADVPTEAELMTEVQVSFLVGMEVEGMDGS